MQNRLYVCVYVPPSYEIKADALVPSIIGRVIRYDTIMMVL